MGMDGGEECETFFPMIVVDGGHATVEMSGGCVEVSGWPSLCVGFLMACYFDVVT